MTPDKAEHTVHRLEAFSDIVIGFCLAQLGLNLVLPKGPTDMFSVWESTTFFVSAFVLIAVLWWLHHRTFSAFFVLNLPMVVLNFGMLCGLILTLYFLESLMHVAGLGQNPARFFVLFIFSFAFVYALVGAMLLTGFFARRSELSPNETRWAIGQLTKYPHGRAVRSHCWNCGGVKAERCAHCLHDARGLNRHPAPEAACRPSLARPKATQRIAATARRLRLSHRPEGPPKILPEPSC